MAKKPGEISISLKADELGLSLENLATNLESEFYQSIEDLANATYANVVAKAQENLNSTRRDFLEGLQFDKVGPNSYVISLNGEWPNALEDGFAGFSQREGMLASQKIVGVGRRAGLPWVQTAKDGHKYAYVPFEQKPFSKEPKGSDLASAIRSIQTTNRRGRRQKITSIFKDESGAPIEGLASIAKGSDLDVIKDAEIKRKLDGLVKYQKNYVNDEGKTTTQSVYIKYAIVSENQDSSKWQHKGYGGLHSFREAEMWADQQIEEILRHFLS